MHSSGWLSGKVKKGSSGPQSGSRMEWAAGRAHHSHPDFAWFADNQQVWQILETVENIAKNKSTFVVSTENNLHFGTFNRQAKCNEKNDDSDYFAK